MRTTLVSALATTVWCVFAVVGLPAARAGAVPQRLRFTQLSTEQGLPQPSVLSIAQDRFGFMWLATQGGVVRFDGYRTIVFRHDREDPGSLSANRVWKIFEDRDGTLWLGTAEGGLERFDAASESFRNYRHDPADPNSLLDDRIWDVYQDRGGAMWVATAAGLARFDPDASTFTRQEIGPGSRESVRTILGVPSGGLWVGTSKRGLVRLDTAAGKIDVLRHDPSDPRSLPDDQVLTLRRDRSGVLWFGTSGGLARLDEATGALRVFRHDEADPRSLGGVQVQAILEDRSGNLWIGTNGGLSVLDRATGTFTNFRHDPSRPESLPNDSVAAMFQDRSGILWFGTWYGGVARADPLTWQTVNYTSGSDPQRSPPGGVLSLYERERGKVWVGTSEGLTLLDLPSGTFSTPGPADRSDVLGVAEDRDGDTWVVRRTGELQEWQDAGPSRTVSLNTNDSRTGYVTAVFGDREGTIWIGHEGLVRLGPGTRLTRWFHRPGDPASLAPSGVKSLAAGRDGSLWIGYSDRGLSRFTPGTGRLEHFRLEAASEGQPSVSAIYEDDSGRVWVATNAGLFRLAPDSPRAPATQSRVRAFTVHDGLASDLLAAILPDDEGGLWLSTAAGISRFDPATETFRNLGVADGALAGGYNKGAALRLHDGRMMFGGPGGLTLFRPEEIHLDPSPPQLALTDLRLFNRTVPVRRDGSGILDRPIHLADRIVLGPADDVVSFEFTALHFGNPPANRYAYELEGFDRQWIETDAEHRTATYTDLPPGNYTLRLRGSNHDQIWNQQGIALAVKVLPPWWRTWWAYLLYVLVAGGLIFGLVYANRHLDALVVSRTAEVRQKARRIQDEHDAKARFIANVSHEFRTPLTLAIAPLEELLNDSSSVLSLESRNNIEVALRNSRRMMGLVGQVLDAGRLETGGMRLQPTESDLAEVIRLECSCFAVAARRRQVRLETELPDRPVFLVYDLDSMEKIISNLLTNAVKFTQEGGAIRVKLVPTDRDVILEVSDTGTGIADDDLPRIFERYYQGSHGTYGQGGTGIGLAIVKDLVELHGGQVEARSRPGEGSTFTVRLPRGCAHFDPASLRSPRFARSEAGSTSPLEPSEIDLDHESADDQRETVLVVDDNPELRSFLALRLSASYHILQAGDGAEALDIARQELPDLIVTDVMMPGLDGLGMTRKLRRDPETAHIPVLLLTARATTRDTVEGLQSGADDYLTKPFDPAELAARIAGILASRRRHGEHLRQPRSESSRPMSFRQRVLEAIEDNLHDSTFGVQDLASALAVDRTRLFRKLKARFGETPSELIRRLRLERAADLLKARKGNASEVGYAVGFTSLSYFGKRFRERYGVPPSRFKQ